MRYFYAVFLSIILVGTGLAAAPQAASPSATQSLLMKIYLDSARVKDLLQSTNTSSWKMTDAQRGAFTRREQAIGGALDALEKVRYAFYYHPQDVSAARQTMDALNGALPQIAQLAKDASTYGGAAGEPFDQALKAFTSDRDNLASYLAGAFPGQFNQGQGASGEGQGATVVGQGTKVGGETTQSAPAPSAPPQAPPPSSSSETSQAPNSSSQPAQPSQSAQPSQPAAQPAAPAASEQPPQSAPQQAAPAEAAALPAPPPPDQIKALLRGVYLTDARVSDLLSLMQPEKWQMPATERALLAERLGAVRSNLATVEKWRYQYLYNLNKQELGQNTVAALGDLVPGILGVETTVAQYSGADAAAQFKQAATQLAAARNTLASDLAAIQANAQAAAQKQLAAASAGLPGGKGLETERITAPSAAPPVSTLTIEPPPLTPAQVKAILYQVYISEFRIRDLLSQERPESWKGASAAEQTMASQARAALTGQLADLEKWRARFSEHPGSMYDAFETYRAVNALFHPLRVFARVAAKYENAAQADDYARRETDMEAQLNGLIPYIAFILQHQDSNLEMFQADLAGCQNQLGYAMHGQVRSSTPMKNIVPVFQGRRVKHKK